MTARKQPTFAEWFEHLLLIAEEHSEEIRLPNTYYNDFEAGLSAEESFFSEYPEYR